METLTYEQKRIINLEYEETIVFLMEKIKKYHGKYNTKEFKEWLTSALMLEIDRPTNVTKIGNNAFKSCVALAKVTIPAKVTSIGTGAFAGCKNLKSVIIKSKKLKKVGSKAFKTVNASAKFKCPAAKLKAYTKLLKKSGVPKNAKITK